LISRRPTPGTQRSGGRSVGSSCGRSTPASLPSGGIRRPTSSLSARCAGHCYVVSRTVSSSKCSPTTSRHDRGHGLARREGRRSVGGLGTDPPGDDDGLGVDRADGGARGRPAPRRGPAVHGEHLRERDHVLGLHRHAVLRRGPRLQRARGALHAHAQGAVSSTRRWGGRGVLRARASSSSRERRTSCRTGSPPACWKCFASCTPRVSGRRASDLGRPGCTASRFLV
jgi:hypothetical protein